MGKCSALGNASSTFLRTTEFLWQEGHTVHETLDEADEWARQMLDIYKDFAENVMAIPVISGIKSESEKFAGAFRTYTIEAMMQDGKALQFATSHNLGTNFAKVFNVSFLDRNGNRQYGSQTSWGLSTRTIGGLIMVHSDDKGLVLPPRLAPIQVVIITIGHGDDIVFVKQKAKEVADTLKQSGIRTEVDARDLRPGEKFYEWEKKGVPVRIELGPKDIAKNKVVLVRRDTDNKQEVLINVITEEINNLLEVIHKNLYKKALQNRIHHTKKVDAWDDFVKAIEEGNFVLAHWCGDADVEKQIKEETGATIRCIPFDQVQEEGKCIKSGKPSIGRVVFAKAY